MDKKFAKLKDLVGSTFTIESVPSYKYKLWDEATGRMVVRDTPERDFRKVHQAETNKGTLDLSQAQIGNLLEAVSIQGQADLRNKTFEVRTNGKTGKDIRYFFNLVASVSNQDVKEIPLDDQPPISSYEDQIDVESIPF